MGIASWNPRSRGYRDAFTHSAQCDSFYSQPCGDVGGVKHVGCCCWCHGTSDVLSVSPDGPLYDLEPPPEYTNSADVYVEPPLFVPESPPSLALSATGPADRSPEEIRANRCSTCGDTLAACECVM